jgi:hypothetical protein
LVSETQAEQKMNKIGEFLVSETQAVWLRVRNASFFQ